MKNKLMELISKEEIKQFLKLSNNKKSKTTDFIYNKLKLKELNEIYKRHNTKNSSQFISDVLSELEISYEISDTDLKRIPKEGGFILLSNHPFGALDGLIICKTDLASSINPFLTTSQRGLRGTLVIR